MKKIQLTVLLMIMCCSLVLNSKAQCPAGQTNIQIDVKTDTYGYECYWQLVPSGNACGVGTIFAGGNTTQVGCNGGGGQDATTAYGYGDNTTKSEGPWCLDSAKNFDIKYVDDWGDGGATFTVFVDGYPMYIFKGSGTGNTFTFTTTPPYTYDAGATSITNPIYVNPGDVFIKGSLFNYGAIAITSLDLNYSVDNGATITQNISGLNILPYTSYDYIHSTPWNPSINGTYSIKVWTGNVNGNADMKTSNDAVSKSIVVGDAIPNIIDDYLTLVPIFTTVASSTQGLSLPRDLDFAPILSDYELWIINKGTENSGGKTITISNAGKDDQTSVVQQDGNAWHFMSLPSGIAFSENGNFATSPDVKDANHGNGHYTGPSLWDPAVYDVPNDGNGSHVDMLHQSPYAMGICSDHDNVFWVNNGYDDVLDYYDFQIPHESGGEDHSDGIVRRYTEIALQKIDDNIVNHLVLDKNSGWLYIVDNGNKRVLRMNANSGSVTGTFAPYGETFAEASTVTGVDYSVYISTGLTQPSGIDVIDNRLIVSDYSNGDIIIYDCSGTVPIELGKIQTGAAGIQGIKIGPDGKIWYVNQTQNKLFRVDFAPLDVKNILTDATISIYPNPTEGMFHLLLPNSPANNFTIKVMNIVGKEVYHQNNVTAKSFNISLENEAAGTYMIEVSDEHSIITKKILLTK